MRDQRFAFRRLAAAGVQRDQPVAFFDGLLHGLHVGRGPRRRAQRVQLKFEIGALPMPRIAFGAELREPLLLPFDLGLELCLLLFQRGQAAQVGTVGRADEMRQRMCTSPKARLRSSWLACGCVSTAQYAPGTSPLSSASRQSSARRSVSVTLPKRFSSTACLSSSAL